MTSAFPRPLFAIFLVAGLAAGFGLAARSATGATPQAAMQDTVGWLMGRWAGNGNLIPASGTPEPYKCVVTYRRADDGHVQQNLRCTGADSKFDASTRLKFDGGRVSGQWQENIHSLSGDVTGAVTASGFEISLTGQFFSAAMRVAGSDCQQDVTLVPTKADQIRQMSASLRKC